jgi:hypothetical protein
MLATVVLMLKVGEQKVSVSISESSNHRKIPAVFLPL